MFLIVILTMFQAVCQVGPTRDIVAGMDKLLNIISVYEYDKSREWLQDFQNIMNKVYQDKEATEETEILMLRFLESDATLTGKQFICKHLGTIATKKSVPVLNQMLTDDKTAEMALFVLEEIPDPAAGKVMRNALQYTHEKIKVAVINSLGVRRDNKAVKMLAKLIHDRDPLISESAISALGAIGTHESSNILRTVSDILTGDQKWIAMDAWLKCADRFVIENNPAEAWSIYKEVYKANPPVFLRKAALRGMFNTTTEDPVNFIAKHIQTNDPEIIPAAISLIYELPDNSNPGRIFYEINGLSATDKICLLTAIAYKGDPSIHQAVIDAINDNDPDMRMAGLEAIARTGNSNDILWLAEKASNLRGMERDRARESLYTMHGPEIDNAILSSIDEADLKKKIELIKSIGERNINSATDLLLKLCESPDPSVRVESVEALGKIASPDDLPDMIQLLMNAQSERERKTFETAVYLVTLKMPDDTRKSRDILDILQSVKDISALNSLITILGEIGDDRDYPVLKEYLNSEYPDIQIAAIKALSTWPNSNPMNDLRSIAEHTQDTKKHTLALRGYIQVVVTDNNLTQDQKFAEIHHAYDIATVIDEKKSVLSGLGTIASFEALKFAESLLDAPGLVHETESAIMSIADNLSWDHPKELREELNKILQMTDSQDLQNEIKDLLKSIEKK